MGATKTKTKTVTDATLDGKQLWERGWNTTMRKKFLSWKPSRRLAPTRLRYAMDAVERIEATAEWREMAREVQERRAGAHRDAHVGKGVRR